MISINKSINNLKKKLNHDNLPKHIAIIMDGNGRWAKKKLLPRSAGHREGVKRVRELVEECGNIGIDFLTIYAFSTENWNRPKDEVNYLMSLLIEFLNKELETLHKNNVKINVLGEIDALEVNVQNEIKKALRKTKNNNKLTLNIALNYGGRKEIALSLKHIIKDLNKGNISIEEIDENLISDYLYTKGQPDPDLLIRTSGELRISNFLIYQLAYTEFYFTDVNWPDFKKKNLYKALIEYQQRNRRFGGL
ncbi:MAG: isoprenyl transferase [Firmicutes bacterium]|nr:isoprenyl transferase [Bacillota bacterium]